MSLTERIPLKQGTLLAVGLILVLLAGCGGRSKDMLPIGPVEDTLSIGDEAPLFTLTAADGGNVSLSDYLGRKHILLYFNMAYE